MKKIYTIAFLIVATLVSMAQGSLDKHVTLSYENEPLGTVLQDMSNAYDVQFIYSSNYVPLEATVSLSVEDVPLKEALTALFDNTIIEHVALGSHVVLKADAAEVDASLNEQPKSDSSRDSEAEYLSKSGMQRIGVVSSLDTRVPEPDFQVERPDNSELLDKKKLQNIPARRRESGQSISLTLVPGVSTYYSLTDTVKKGVSFNIISGRNIHMEGVEIGLFLNESLKSFNGLQMAGFGNITGGNFEGGQLAGLFNFNKAHTGGIQMAGLVNGSKSFDGIQASGLMNIVENDALGLQLSGLANYAADSKYQASGLTNVSRGDTKLQVSGLVNFADTVQVGQIAGLVNIAKAVHGFQIGLINIADTISGPSIGLITWAKKGYRRLEIMGSESLHSAIGFKFGTEYFYTQVFSGFNYGNVGEQTRTIPVPVEIEEDELIWGVGAGIGSLIPLGTRFSLNLEANAIHINEGEVWTDQLNLLNQIKVGVDYRLGRKTSVFIMPSLNVMVSHVYNSTNNEFGSDIVPYSFYNHTDFRSAGQRPVNVRMWFGLSGGFRF